MILRPVPNIPQIRTPRTDKHGYTRKLRVKTAFEVDFSPFFVILSLRMRRNTINSTSSSKLDLRFGFLVPKNIYTREIRLSNCILWTFSLFFVIELLRMRRNTIYSTSGFKIDLKFGFLVPKNIYGIKFCRKKRRFDPFLLDFTI